MPAASMARSYWTPLFGLKTGGSAPSGLESTPEHPADERDHRDGAGDLLA